MKGKMKKILSLLLGATLSFSVLACGKDKKTDSAPPEEGGQEVALASRTQGIDFDKALGNVADYAVVIPGLPTATEKYAAEHFIDYVEQITGTRISYANDGKYSNRRVISIGNTQFLETSGVSVDKEKLKNDGFLIKNVDDAIVIVGGEDKGTLHGVYDFLEYQLGIKWLTPTDTYVPDDQAAKVYATDRTEIPAFNHRIYLAPSTFYNDSAEFSTHLRYSSEYLLTVPDSMGGNMKMYQGITATHNSMDWVNYSRYIENGKIKDEYMHAFSNDGETILTMEGSWLIHQYALDICFTDGINADGSYETEHVGEDGTVTPTAIAMAIEGMKEHILNDETKSNYYMFGQMDVSPRGCRCPKCLQDFELYGDSGIVIRFVNALASAIEEFVEEEKIEREINIVTFAYSYSAAAPVTLNADGKYQLKHETCDPRSNVIIRLAPIAVNYLVPYGHQGLASSALGADFMERWQFVHNRFFLWDYTTYTNNWYYYQPSLYVWPQKLRKARDMGIEYAMIQSNYLERPVYQTIMECYVTSKLLWNPNYELNEIVDEWHRYYFGEEAAEYTQRAENLYAWQAYTTMEKQDWNWEPFYATKGMLNSVFSLIDQAREAINASDATAEEKKSYLSHLELFELQPRYMYLYHYMEFETSTVSMAEYAKSFISDALRRGAVWYGEGDTRRFNLENVIFTD